MHKWTHYFPIYERHFWPFVNKATTFIEIGVSKGGSLQLWKNYLGPHAHIIGIDIDKKCKEVEEDQISVRIGDQRNTKFLEKIIDEFGAPDVVLDDGSHMMADMAASFKYLYPRLTKNGVYMVEDLHTAYYEEYGGGLHNPESFIEKSKNLIDELNAERSRGAVPVSEFSKTTVSIHCYDGVFVFERGLHLKKHAHQRLGSMYYAPNAKKLGKRIARPSYW